MVVVAFAGCANGLVGQGATGTLTTKLTVAPGVEETEINYTITGNGLDPPLTGTVDVVSNPVTAEIAGIPVGSGYTITLATADGICTGSATFDVAESQTTTVAVPIQCTTTPPKRGNVLVNGTFLTCPTIGSMVVSPTSVAVGSTIQVSASAKDLGQGTLTYKWTATNDGTFANPAAAKTTYMCATTGTKTLTITVSNVSCNDSLSVDVTCGQGGGVVCGDGIVSGNEKCDTAIAAGQTGACPTSCTGGDVCAPNKLQGSDCQAACVATPITVAVCGDGCVTSPETCEPPSTATCDATCKTIGNNCGNGTVDTADGETCDTAIAAGQTGACPTSCTAPDACTTSTLQAGGTCTAKCVNAPITPCCGNGVKETGETCDTAIAAGQTGACPTSCTAPNTCTNSVLQNNGTCTAACVETPITPCCGNSIVETGEDCDPPDGTTCDATCHFISTCLVMDGTWITRITTTGTITAPSPVGTLTGANIDVVQRMVINHVGDNFVANFEICSLSTVASGSVPFSSDYSPAVLASMSGTGSAPYVCLHVGDTAALPSFTVNTGWGGSVTPAGCTCPAAGSTYPPASPLPTTCCGAVDSDGDGVYGITLPTHLFNGALNLWAYAGLTMNITLKNMVVTDPNTNTGTTAFPTNGWIFGSTSGATGTLNVAPVSDNVPVTAIKLAGDVPCSTVLTHCSGAACIP